MWGPNQCHEATWLQYLAGQNDIRVDSSCRKMRAQASGLTVGSQSTNIKPHALYLALSETARTLFGRWNKLWTVFSRNPGSPAQDPPTQQGPWSIKPVQQKKKKRPPRASCRGTIACRSDINKNRVDTDQRPAMADRPSLSGIPCIARTTILKWQIAGQLRLGSCLLGLVSRSHRRKRRRQ